MPPFRLLVFPVFMAKSKKSASDRGGNCRGGADRLRDSLAVFQCGGAVHAAWALLPVAAGADLDACHFRPADRAFVRGDLEHAGLHGLPGAAGAAVSLDGGGVWHFHRGLRHDPFRGGLHDLASGLLVCGADQDHHGGGLGQARRSCCRRWCRGWWGCWRRTAFPRSGSWSWSRRWPDAHRRWRRNCARCRRRWNSRCGKRTSSLSQANSALTFYETIFKTSAWGVAVVDSVRGLIQMANPAFARMHGYEPDQMTGMPLAETFAPEAA